MRSRTRTSSTPTSGSRWRATDSWAERIKLLLPYQVNEELVKASKSPTSDSCTATALHNTNTDLGAELDKKYGVKALEVTDEVFESKTSIVFDQAENRLHTIKAIMVATLAGV